MRPNGAPGASPSAPGSPAWRLVRLDRPLGRILDGTLDSEAGELALSIICLAMVPGSLTFNEQALADRRPGIIQGQAPADRTS